MTSGEPPPKGVVLVAHGGQASSTEPTFALQPAVLRMIPVAAAIRQAVRGSGALVRRPVSVSAAGTARRPPGRRPERRARRARRGVRNVPSCWSGTPWGRAPRSAPPVTRRSPSPGWRPGCPRRAGCPAPGLRVLLAHGTAHTTTSPAETWAYAERARAFSNPAAVEVHEGDHPMLRRARLWHAIAAEFARAALALPPGDAALNAAVTAADGSRVVL